MARELFSDGHEPFESIHGLLLFEVAMYFCFVHSFRKVYIYPSTYIRPFNIGGERLCSSV